MATLYGRTLASVFDLRGTSETDLTAALGWTLDACETFRALFGAHLGIGDLSNSSIDMEVTGVGGRTDLEIVTGDSVTIIEAKKGWLLPHELQLARYASRVRGPQGLLLSLSDSSSSWAETVLVPSAGGVPTRHLPWDEVRKLVKEARKTARAQEKMWLDQLLAYLAKGTSVRSPEDQWVYCVVLNRDPAAVGADLTLFDLPTERHLYAHPWGGANGWPKRPPTFMAFRWNGAVRQINRVISSRAVENISDLLPEIPRGADEALMAYDLGPDIPMRPLKNGRTWASGRVWALLDQMLVAETLSDAVAASKVIADST